MVRKDESKMKTVKDMTRNELESLIEDSVTLMDLFDKKKREVRRGYQTWYTRAIPIVRQLIPERLDEFLELYEQKDSPYAISKYLRRTAVNTDQHTTACMRFFQQTQILNSAITRLDETFTNIYGLVQAEILDSEVDAATELLKAGHLRASGTLAGVVLERHLAKVCSGRDLKSSKKNPTIADWNEILKNENICDIPTWRNIQYLADIRNLCAHVKEREPKTEEVDELVRGVERITKTIF